MIDTLSFCGREEAITRMNCFGSEGRPFFFLIDYIAEKCLVEEPHRLPSSELLFAFPGATNVPQGMPATPHPRSFRWEPCPMSFEEYRRGFDIVHRHLHGGNSFLVNYTCATLVDTDLTLRQVFDHARAPYRLWVNDSFVVFSPEIFVRITDGFIYSHPMKGTMDATLPDARERLLADPKENAEHVMLVDLARNDLSRNCHDTHVEFYKQPQYYSHVIHLVSRVSGTLDKEADPIKTFIDTFPAGTLSGAPKVKAMQLISEIEPHNRGAYGGCIGFIGLNGDLNQAITIRTFVSRNNELWFQAGGGIVAKSDENNELQEVNNKLGALKKAILLAEKI